MNTQVTEPSETRPVFGAVVVAGGAGTRFGSDVPKQFLDLGGRLIWRRSCDLFLRRVDIRSTVLVLPADRLGDVSVFGLTVVSGGKTRSRSAENGIRALDSSVTHVAIHDAARPLADDELVNKVLAAAAEFGAAVPACPVASTVRYAIDCELGRTVDRDGLHEIQTPQVARRDWLLDAFSGDADDTDEAGLLMAAGYPVRSVIAPRRNFKITTPDDLALAASIVRGDTP